MGVATEGIATECRGGKNVRYYERAWVREGVHLFVVTAFSGYG